MSAGVDTFPDLPTKQNRSLFRAGVGRGGRPRVPCRLLQAYRGMSLADCRPSATSGMIPRFT